MHNQSAEALWKVLLGEQSVSGLSKKAFCEQRGLNPATFYYWQRRFRAAQPPSSASGFHRLVVQEEHEVKVCLPQGEVVLRSASATTLAQVIKRLVDA